MSEPIEVYRAVRTWGGVGAATHDSLNVETLKEESKSAVYRVRQDSPPGTFIAKRCRHEVAGHERFLYETVFPTLPITTLTLYGSVGHDDPDYAWLFLEDGGDQRYSPADEQHVDLAARWLAGLHASTPVNPLGPDRMRGSDHYLGHLWSGRELLRRHRSNSVLSEQSRHTVDRLVKLLDLVESHWEEASELCTQAPGALVHGDFVAKNVRVQNGAAGSSRLVPFDWEETGWGVPADDLAYLTPAALATYCDEVRAAWPQIDVEQVRRLSFFGKLFRNLAGIEWAGRSLRFDWADAHVRQTMRLYAERLSLWLTYTSWGR